MAQGFEVDWDALHGSGKRMLGTQEELADPRRACLQQCSAYGVAALQDAARALQGAWVERDLTVGAALEGLAEGLRASADHYAEADAGAAALRMRMYVDAC